MVARSLPFSKVDRFTQVHHVDGKGHDSGVVYSEMQGRENTSGDLMALRYVGWSTSYYIAFNSDFIIIRMQRLMNPPGNAYRSETGGLMEALRVLTPDQSKE
jgi:Zn-dependent M16 (insulinase) family peptidase